MALILLALDYPPARGGIQRYCLELARVLRRQGEQVLVIASAQPQAAALDAAQDFPTLRVSADSRTSAALALVQAAEQAIADDLLGEPVSAVLCGKWFPEGAAALLLRRRLGLPYVVLAYGREVTLTGLNVMKWLMQRTVVRGATGALAISHYTLGQVRRRGLAEGRGAVIYAGVEPAEFQPDPGAVAAWRQRLGLGEEKTLLTVSRLVSRKGQDQVLRALPQVREAVGPVRYLVAGEGPAAGRLRELAARLGLAEAVSFLGEVPDADLPALYALADVFVMPSRDLPGQPIEGFGLVYLEATLCGTPCVGGCTGGTPEALLDGETGLLVDPERPAEIAAALERLLTEPGLGERLVAAGQERLRAQFTWDHVAAGARQALAGWGLLPPGEES